MNRMAVVFVLRRRRGGEMLGVGLRNRGSADSRFVELTQSSDSFRFAFHTLFISHFFPCPG